MLEEKLVRLHSDIIKTSNNGKPQVELVIYKSSLRSQKRLLSTEDTDVIRTNLSECAENQDILIGLVKVYGVQDFSHIISPYDNRVLSSTRFPITVPLFKDGRHPIEDLSLSHIGRVEDIDNLSRYEVIEYLSGYGISSDTLETIRLKERLRFVLVFNGRYDYIYVFKN